METRIPVDRMALFLALQFPLLWENFSVNSQARKIILVNNRWATVVLLIISFWTSAAAQELEVIKVDTSLVAVNVSVTDEKKRCILDLTIENFRVTDQGKPVTIEFFDNKGPV